MSNLLISRFSAPFAEIITHHDGNKLWQLQFYSIEQANNLTTTPLPIWLRQPLTAYFAGDFIALEQIPVELKGTPFQLRVWSALRRIPAQSTWSYAELARQIGKPKAIRAVGGANGRNPIALVVPCHRVIASNGALGGYSGGLGIKEWLLSHEGITIHV